MKPNGKVMTEVMIIEKDLRTLTQRYDHIVVAIEEPDDLDTLNMEDLQGSLEAHELRVKERSVANTQVQALQAHISKKFNQDAVKYKKGKRKFKWYKNQDLDEGVGTSKN